MHLGSEQRVYNLKTHDGHKVKFRAYVEADGGLRATDSLDLQDAKARFSELVRKVRSEGPQHVTVHGHDGVVVIAAEEFRRLKGSLTGQSLIDAIQACPYREVDIEPKRAALPVRDVSL